MIKQIIITALIFVTALPLVALTLPQVFPYFLNSPFNVAALTVAWVGLWAALIWENNR